MSRADGQGGTMVATEEQLRAAVARLTSRSPDWPRENMTAVQTLAGAITELLTLRDQAAASAAVVAAAEAYGQARHAVERERALLRAVDYAGGRRAQERYHALCDARDDAEEALYASWQAARGVAS